VIVSTVNVNGIRAAIKQRSSENLGLLPWLAQTRADVVCLQETRADDEQLAGALRPALSDRPPRKLGGTPWYLASAGGDLKGRNGVAVPVVVMAGEGIRQTTQVGASTTSWPPTDWGRGPTPRGWSGPRPMRCAGPTMLR